MPNESLSALLDGECSDSEMDRLLAQLEGSPALMDRFGRLSRARSAVQGVALRPVPDLAASVMAALANEPLPAAEPVVSGKVVDLGSRRRAAATAPRERAERAWKPLVGFAAAASMGAAAVLVLSPRQGTVPQADERYVSAPGYVQVSNGGGGLGGMLQTVSADAEDTPRWPVSSMEGADQLREYLFDHSNSAAAQGVGGTLRFARFAAHNADYRPDALDGQR